MDKGSKERSPPHNLRQKPGQYICCQNHKLIADIENEIMDPVMQCTPFPAIRGFSQQKLSYLSRDDTPVYLLTSHSEIVDIEKVAIFSSLRSTKNQNALIESKLKINSKSR
ncbi:hypothetical protein Tco_1040516 [Tanacetum coccineum]